jgi:carbon storage regulator CsrA
MLVLSRKNRESVIVGRPGTGDQMVKVTVLQVRGGKVTLGIEGDRNIPILRSELWERIHSTKSACLADSC